MATKSISELEAWRNSPMALRQRLSNCQDALTAAIESAIERDPPTHPPVRNLLAKPPQAEFYKPSAFSQARPQII
jgi:hypothetical protein